MDFYAVHLTSFTDPVHVAIHLLLELLFLLQQEKASPTFNSVLLFGKFTVKEQGFFIFLGKQLSEKKYLKDG